MSQCHCLPNVIHNSPAEDCATILGQGTQGSFFQWVTHKPVKSSDLHDFLSEIKTNV